VEVAAALAAPVEVAAVVVMFKNVDAINDSTCKMGQ
jgi:hypothetical protein